MGRAILVGSLAAIFGALIVNLILWIAPFGLLVFPLVVGIGYLVGEGVRIGSGNKLDRRLKYVAFGITFIGWAIAVAIAPVFGISITAFGGIFGVVAMIVAIYVAAYRVRVP